MLRNLVDGGFEGPAFPVNRAAAHVRSVRAYPTIADIGDDVEVDIRGRRETAAVVRPPFVDRSPRGVEPVARR